MAKSNAEFTHLRPRSEGDLMRLWMRIYNELKDLFNAQYVRLLPGQIETLGAAVEAVFKAAPGSVAVVPLAPGGGKSTLIRAFLKVAAEVLRDMRSLLAQRLGGVIVVVEKSDEAQKAIGAQHETVIPDPDAQEAAKAKKRAEKEVE